MKILDGPMLAPNCCIICEQTPDVSYIDTLKEFVSDVYHRMNGRKYVCAECMESLAKVAGYEHSSKVKQADDVMDTTRDKLINLIHLLEDGISRTMGTYNSL